jgi:hypothetical protein
MIIEGNALTTEEYHRALRALHISAQQMPGQCYILSNQEKRRIYVQHEIARQYT